MTHYDLYLSVCLELNTDLETIKESYTNTVNELNQELLVVKEAYEQLDNEKQALINELEQQRLALHQQEDKQTTGQFSFFSTRHLKQSICFFRSFTNQFICRSLYSPFFINFLLFPFLVLGSSSDFC